MTFTAQSVLLNVSFFSLLQLKRKNGRYKVPKKSIEKRVLLTLDDIVPQWLSFQMGQWGKPAQREL